jgi:site-specific DNA-methyltransferase (adenine-specific)
METFMSQLKFETWPIERLIEYARNPRKNDHAVDKIAGAIKEFGFRIPVIAKSDGLVVDGHLRLKAAKKLGLAEVPVILADDMTDAQIKAFRISVNRMAEFAEWDNDLLALEFDELTELGFDLDLTGFTAEEIAALTPEEIPPGLTDEDAVPEVPEQPVTVLGDVWILGKHRLMCGDSTNVDAVSKLTDGGEGVDMLLTDPPYNVAYEGATKEKMTIQNDNMGNDQFRQFLRDAFVTADTVMKKGAVFYIWHADTEGYNFRGACNDAGWKVRQCLIWKKSSMVMGRQDYHWKHEPCLYGWKEGAGHLWATDRKQTTILEFDKPHRNGEHPTMKPVGLFEYQMLNNTKGGDIVLDLFGGSGTTMLAAEKHGRHSYLMELDPKYCDVIIKRWQDYTGKIATHAETGKPFAEVTNDKQETSH